MYYGGIGHETRKQSMQREAGTRIKSRKGIRNKKEISRKESWGLGIGKETH